MHLHIVKIIGPNASCSYALGMSCNHWLSGCPYIKAHYWAFLASVRMSLLGSWIDLVTKAGCYAFLYRWWSAELHRPTWFIISLWLLCCLWFALFSHLFCMSLNVFVGGAFNITIMKIFDRSIILNRLHIHRIRNCRMTINVKRWLLKTTNYFVLKTAIV